MSTKATGRMERWMVESSDMLRVSLLKVYLKTTYSIMKTRCFLTLSMSRTSIRTSLITLKSILIHVRGDQRKSSSV
jgi:hypothetical protein